VFLSTVFYVALFVTTLSADTTLIVDACRLLLAVLVSRFRVFLWLSKLNETGETISRLFKFNFFVLTAVVIQLVPLMSPTLFVSATIL